MELIVDAVTATHPGVAAVTELSLKALPGTVVAVVGPNGCGKSTLLRAIARLHRPDAGSIRVGGQDVWQLRPRAAARLVALLPQAPVAPEAVTVRGLVAFGRHPHQGVFRQWSRQDEDESERAIRQTGVADLADRRVDTLSGGQRQRCWLAMVLAQQTPVVLLDEPTSALDLGHAVEMLGLVRQVAAAGRTVVMVIHDLAAAARYADLLVAMRDGAVIAQGEPREVVDRELVRALYDIDVDVLPAPVDGSPVIVPRLSAP